MDTSSHKFIGQIGAEGAHDVFTSIRALDTGIANHEAWLSQIHQSLICGGGHDNPNDTCEDAHCRCKFGQWLYSSETDDFQELDSFHSVVEKHQKMHALARNLLIKKENRLEIVEKEYSKFTSQAISFKLDVRNLQYILMSQVCVVDHLTGAWNRYAMYSKLHQEKERLTRAGHPSTICMMDLDHFKEVNDTYGHKVGDKVLATVIEFCRTGLRTYDSIYRYGGEEFLFSLPDAELSEVRSVIERLCDGLGKHPILLPNGESLSVTASFGIASLKKSTSIEDTIQEADHALLCAKAKGRDQVCCWEDGLSLFE
ncbi:MAG: diguanylate cyclase [Gammaproteobacteria bacterium]|nr:diguanylate cyclase [Gammaproteobacteria bacterium]